MRLLWTPVAILFSIGLVLGFFQNCTPAVPFGNTDYYSELVNSPVFPYEVGVDQVAYLSCSEQEDIFNDGTFFSFRVGAYEDLGLRINQDYRDSIEKVADGNVVSALMESSASAGKRIQLAIRTLDNLQLMYVDQENAEGIDGSDYNNFFPMMGDEGLTNLLWYMEPGDYIRYWAGAQFINDYRFEGDIQFMKSQIMENDLRSFLSGRGVIALSFAEEGKTTPLGPGSLADLQQQADSAGTNGSGSSANTDIRKNIFGMAMQPKFKQSLFRKRKPGTTGASPFDFIDVNPGSDMPPRILSSMTEIKIDERSSVANPRPWSCPSEMSFMIVLPQHAQSVVAVRNSSGVIQKDGSGNPITHTVTRCEMKSDPINPSAELKRIRQSLFAEDWYIDMERKCIVPKPDHVQEGSCYGLDSGTQKTHIINYDTYDTLGCGFGNVEGLCPHYASICFRQ